MARLPRVRIPLFRVELPELELPPAVKAPRLNDRRREALRYAIMDDVGEKVPLVGDVLADLAYAELRKLLTEEEFRKFTEYNKVMPSTLALLKVFMEVEAT